MCSKDTLSLERAKTATTGPLPLACFLLIWWLPVKFCQSRSTPYCLTVARQSPVCCSWAFEAEVSHLGSWSSGCLMKTLSLGRPAYELGVWSLRSIYCVNYYITLLPFFCICATTRPPATWTLTTPSSHCPAPLWS